MSAWFNDHDAPLLVEDAVQIAFNFLARSGEIDDPAETVGFLADKVQFMISQGQRNKLALANRAIAAFQRYRQARTTELSLLFGQGGLP
ncbi:hypothetical protein [Bradyrhizobium sp. ARR65]|uniref:hypothetical protein n=1 Tax=Bradyrhizobium sp. ARR65 TaxID=1040989 RepID=UPI0004673265|nr:hypothetical protein [Bradyrhizobium sp. ARR65]